MADFIDAAAAGRRRLVHHYQPAGLAQRAQDRRLVDRLERAQVDDIRVHALRREVLGGLQAASDRLGAGRQRDVAAAAAQRRLAERHGHARPRAPRPA
jgi:hypothetical protein